jgi:N-acetyl-1-D-myo-inositol-2-amino-2-deoxy-alpha-D-glucopyranoside deacetylase
MSEAARLLVTVAHPDDETFGTGSVIALAAEHGAQVTVCCATRGEAGDVPGLTSAAEIGALREDELRSAGAALGVAQFILLDYADSGMTGQPGRQTLAGAPLGDVISDVRNVVDQVKPDVVVTLDPDYGDGHRDHAIIGQATVQACRDLPETRVYAWTVPRALLGRWFAELENVRPDSKHLELDQGALGRPEDQITTVLDTRHGPATAANTPCSDISQTLSQLRVRSARSAFFAGLPTDVRGIASRKMTCRGRL